MTKQKTEIEMVKEFHQTFEHPILQTPAIPDAKRCELRYNLIAEEAKELKLAFENGDLVEVADALADLQYVLSGAILEFGFADKFKEIFEEVHRSNMSKACIDEVEAQMTVSFHENGPNGEPCHYVNRDGKFLVFRTRDMKTMKSVNYSPANIKKLIN